MTNEEIISELELLNTRAKELVGRLDVSEIPLLQRGECCFGASWEVCPCCKTSMQMVGRAPLLKKERYTIYRCEGCKSLVADM